MMPKFEKIFLIIQIILVKHVYMKLLKFMQYHVLNYLLKHDIDVNIVNKDGVTALHRAVDLGKYYIISKQNK